MMLGFKRSFLSVFSNLQRKFKVAERIDGPEESPFPLSDVPVRTRGAEPPVTPREGTTRIRHSESMRVVSRGTGCRPSYACLARNIF
jgi:hypothetical protein